MTQDEGGVSRDENGIYYALIPQPPQKVRLALKLDTNLDLYSRVAGQGEFKKIDQIKFPTGLSDIQKKSYLYQLLLYADNKINQSEPEHKEKSVQKDSVKRVDLPKRNTQTQEEDEY